MFFWGLTRLLAKMKCPKYFSRAHDERLVPSIKQHLSSVVCFSDQWRSVFAFHLISQLLPNIRISSYTASPGDSRTHPGIFFQVLSLSHSLTVYECVCVCGVLTMFTCLAAGISGSRALTGWPIPKPSVITGIKLFKATDSHFLLLPLKKCSACSPHTHEYSYMTAQFKDHVGVSLVVTVKKCPCFQQIVCE